MAGISHTKAPSGIQPQISIEGSRASVKATLVSPQS